MADPRTASDVAPGPSDLVADCSRCFGLCCVALPFARSSDFPLDKAAGTPCRNLRGDFSCSIHARLRDEGFAGCTVYDCFGAGQKVAQVTYRGRSWREEPGTADEMFAVFAVVRQLHEMLRHLDEATRLMPDLGDAAAPEGARPHQGAAAGGALGRLRELTDRTEDLTRATPEVLLALDVPAHRADVGTLLREVSARARRVSHGSVPDHRGADLVGARLRGADLRRADLCGAYLIGADLRGADLRRADVLGADLRGADVRGADLSDALYLTTAQAASARGDAATRLPEQVPRPAHWPA